MLERITALLLFFYGTTPDAVSHHMPQARMVAMTLGGIIAFVTLPFVLAGTFFLVGSAIPEESFPGMRWAVVVGFACMLTLAIVWVERALVILGDAVAGNWISQGLLLAVRLVMIWLFSVVIAGKWEMAEHRGLIRSELQTMGDEAMERHETYASREYDVHGLNTRKDAVQSRLKEVEGSLASLPPELVAAKSRTRECQLTAARLTAERTALEGIVSPTADQLERLSALKPLAAVESAECKQLAANTRQRIHDYESPLRTDLEQLRKELPQLSNAHSQAAANAKEVFRERVKEARLALSESGSDEKAFVRVRQNNPDIDRSVKEKTLMLAAIELLPLLLKILLRNSPIAAEARAMLQEHSAHYRIRELQSLAIERAARHWAAPRVPTLLPGSILVINPHRLPPASRPDPSIPASELTADGYWIGHANT